jgi:hypothetical protein
MASQSPCARCIFIILRTCDMIEWCSSQIVGLFNLQILKEMAHISLRRDHRILICISIGFCIMRSATVLRKQVPSAVGWFCLKMFRHGHQNFST